MTSHRHAAPWFAVLLTLSIAFAVMLAQSAHASPLRTVEVTRGVYAFVGEKMQRSPANLANNATFGLVVTDEGAVLIDPGGSWNGARALHEAIKAVTAQPVKFVVNTGGQDHRWLGNAYWRAQGATIIAANAAVADHKERGSMQLSMLTQLLGAELTGTEPAYADLRFDDAHRFRLGGLVFEVHHPGHAHTPGDSFVWLPASKVVFTGDIVYVERILGVGAQSKSSTWIEAFDAIAALEPDFLVPGHGAPTNLAKAKADTYDYLVNLRTQMKIHMETGGDMIKSVSVDQSAFAYLEQFEALAGRNAQQVFSEMEFE